MLSTSAKTDAALRQDVLDALDFDPRVTATHIGVIVDSGIVTLTGKVASFNERYVAGKDVLGVQGVQALADELEIDLPDLHRRDDADVARAITQALTTSVLAPHGDLKIKVRAGSVTLSGEVDWYYQKQAAETTVRLTTGVTSVIDLITIRARPQASWSAVKKQISSAFQRHASLDANKVQVEIDGGLVTLRGTVRSWTERHDAELAAWSAPGVHEVNNLIDILYSN